MSIANVNIGAVANDGTGDPLRSAFRKINENFANLAAISGNANVVVFSTGNANVTTIYNAGVESVAGRKGNIVLSVADVVGAASIGYVNTIAANLSNVAVHLAGQVSTVTWANVTGKPTFAPIATSGSWNDLTDVPLTVMNAVTQSEIDLAVDTINANVTAANLKILRLQNSVDSLNANATVQQSEISGLRANIEAANAAVTTVDLTSVNANIAAANSAILTLTVANVAQQSYINLNTSRVNAANLEITYLRANVTAANAAIVNLGNDTSSRFDAVQVKFDLVNSNVHTLVNTVSDLGARIDITDQVQSNELFALQASVGVLTGNVGGLAANAGSQGHSIELLNANIGAYQTWANANSTDQTMTFDSINANVAAANLKIGQLIYANTLQAYYIDVLNANVRAANTAIYNLGGALTRNQMDIAYMYANAATQSTDIGNLQANTVQIASNVAILYSNAASQAGDINYLYSNAIVQRTQIVNVQENLNAQIIRINQLFANAATQDNSLTTLFSNAASQASVLNVIDANLGAVSDSLRSIDSNLTLQTNRWVFANLTFDNINAGFVGAQLQINAVNANVEAANAAIITSQDYLVGLIGVTTANAQAQQDALTAANLTMQILDANIGLISNEIGVLDAHVASLELLFDNANVLFDNIAGVESNLSIAVNHLDSNVAQLLGNVDALTFADSQLRGNITAANVEISKLRSNITAANTTIITSNSSMKTYVDNKIAEAMFEASSYGDASVEVYLPMDPTIIDIYGNLGGLHITDTDIYGNLGSIHSTLDLMDANVGVITDTISSIQITEGSTSANVADIQAKFDENGNLLYTPIDPTHWTDTVSNVAAALDQLAARIWAIENP